MAALARARHKIESPPCTLARYRAGILPLANDVCDFDPHLTMRSHGHRFSVVGRARLRRTTCAALQLCPATSQRCRRSNPPTCPSDGVPREGSVRVLPAFERNANIGSQLNAHNRETPDIICETSSRHIAQRNHRARMSASICDTWQKTRIPALRAVAHSKRGFYGWPSNYV